MVVQVNVVRFVVILVVVVVAIVVAIAVGVAAAFAVVVALLLLWWWWLLSVAVVVVVLVVAVAPALTECRLYDFFLNVRGLFIRSKENGGASGCCRGAMRIHKHPHGSMSLACRHGACQGQTSAIEVASPKFSSS